MTNWAKRSPEEKSLLNPSFCACLLWHAALGYTGVDQSGLPFEEAFLILPILLHRKTRETLPRDTRSSLAVWLENHPLARGQVATRARLLIKHTKEGILFGGMYGLIRIEMGRLYASHDWGLLVNHSLGLSSNEVRECAKKAEFLGKWFAKSGNAPTVLALMGVRP
jgi:hypothetical protein